MGSIIKNIYLCASAQGLGLICNSTLRCCATFGDLWSSDNGYWLLGKGGAEKTEMGSGRDCASERESLIRKKHKNNGMLLMVLYVVVCVYGWLVLILLMNRKFIISSTLNGNLYVWWVARSIHTWKRCVSEELHNIRIGTPRRDAFSSMLWMVTLFTTTTQHKCRPHFPRTLVLDIAWRVYYRSSSILRIPGAIRRSYCSVMPFGWSK